jgi:hypothetical protein
MRSCLGGIFDYSDTLGILYKLKKETSMMDVLGFQRLEENMNLNPNGFIFDEF